MAMSYEDAMTSLQTMFGGWTRQDLDAVLRHYKGCMEVTIESLLAHGDQSPDSLLKKLRYGEGLKIDTLVELTMTEEQKHETRELFGLVGDSSVDDEKLQVVFEMKQKLADLQDPSEIARLIPDLIEVLKILPSEGQSAMIVHCVKPSPLRMQLCQELLESCFGKDMDSTSANSDDGIAGVTENEYLVLSGGRHNVELNLDRYFILGLLSTTADKMEDAGMWICETCLYRMSYQGINDNHLYSDVRHSLLRFALLVVTRVLMGSSSALDTQIIPIAWKTIEDSCADPELPPESAILVLSPHWFKASRSVHSCYNSKDLLGVLNAEYGGSQFVQSMGMNPNADIEVTQREFINMKAKAVESRKREVARLVLDLDLLKGDVSARAAIERYRRALSMLGESNDDTSIRLLAESHSLTFAPSCLLGLEDKLALGFLEGLGHRLEDLLESDGNYEDAFFDTRIDDNDSLDVLLPTIIDAYELTAKSAQLAAFSTHMMQQVQLDTSVVGETESENFVQSFRLVVERSDGAEFVIEFLHKMMRKLAKTPLCHIGRVARLTIIISEVVRNVKRMFATFQPISPVSDRDRVVETVLFGSLDRYFLLVQQSSDFLKGCQVCIPSFDDYKAKSRSHSSDGEGAYRRESEFLRDFATEKIEAETGAEGDEDALFC